MPKGSLRNVNAKTARLKTSEIFNRFNPQDCFICGKPFELTDKVMEVKARLFSKVTGQNWYKAHAKCACTCPGEHYLMEPRKIRTIETKKLIKPKKVVPSWGVVYSPLEKARGE